MVCTYCSSKTKVTNSRTSVKAQQTWRRRQCLSCSAIVTTYEHIDYASALRVQNTQNDLQPFSRDKLFMSLYNSLQHRKTALGDAAELTGTLMAELLTVHINGVVKVEVIINSARKVLERFDEVAAGVYCARHL